MSERTSGIRAIVDQDGNGRIFNDVLAQMKQQGVQDIGDLTIITKKNGTESGRPVAMITFTAVIEGKPQLVQTVTTLRLLMSTLEILKRHHPEMAP